MITIVCTLCIQEKLKDAKEVIRSHNLKDRGAELQKEKSDKIRNQTWLSF
jgi:hypothetical protein